MSNSQISQKEWSTVNIQKLVSDKVETIAIEGENVLLNIPITFFAEAGDRALENAITGDSVPSLVHRLDEIYRLQAEFTGNSRSLKMSVFIRKGDIKESQAATLANLEKELGEDFQWQTGAYGPDSNAIAVHVPEPARLRALIDFSDQEEIPNLTSVVAHEMGHFFEEIESVPYEGNFDLYNENFQEIWPDILAIYTCERLNTSFKRYQLTTQEIENYKKSGNYALLSANYSPYAQAMLLEIKDVGGWDIFKHLFHELGMHPIQKGTTNEERWLKIRDLILEKSNIDIAPILYTYHVPLPKGTYEPLAFEMKAEGSENILSAGTASSSPYNYSFLGNEGHTVMYGSPYGDKYYGGQGKDELKFLGNKRGQDTFFNFDPLTDKIIMSFKKGQTPKTEQVGSDFVFSWENGDSLTLDTIDRSQLKNENFTFLEVSESGAPKIVLTLSGKSITYRLPTPDESLTDYGDYNPLYGISSTGGSVLVGREKQKDIFIFLSSEDIFQNSDIEDDLNRAFINDFSREDGDIIIVPTRDFEHTMRYARQIETGAVYTVFDFEDSALTIGNSKISDFKETDFRYQKHSEVSFDDVIKNEQISSPSLEELYDQMTELTLGALGGVESLTGLELWDYLIPLY